MAETQNPPRDSALYQGLREAMEIVKQSPRGNEDEVPTSFADRLIKLRHRLGLSQAQFADRYGLPIGTVRNWEQGRRSKVDASGSLLLSLIERDPDGMAVKIRDLAY